MEGKMEGEVGEAEMGSREGKMDGCERQTEKGEIITT